MTKKKTATTRDLSKKTQAVIQRQAKYNKKKLIASLIRHRIQDDGINPVNDADLDDLEKWIFNLLDGYYD